nr:head-tail joining protein [Escherichia coli]
MILKKFRSFAGGVRFEDSSPSLFVKTADIYGATPSGYAGGWRGSFRVDRITPDDGGMLLYPPATV